MRATRHPIAGTAVGSDAPARRDVIVRPAPVAMVWQGPGVPHAAIAVPGVALGAGDVLVAVELATVCPADADIVVGGAAAAAPLVLGHEQVGRVVAAGPAASTSDGTRLVVGMRVVWSRRIGCGECDSCRDGVTSACRDAREYGADRLRRGWELSGGFASHVLVREGTTVLTVPEVVPAAVLAPLSCATALAAAAVEHITQVADVEGETIVVCGADLVGLTIVAMLADEGALAVVVEPDGTRRARALDFGAHGAVNGFADLARLIRADRIRGERERARPLRRPVAVVGSDVAEAGRPGAGASGSEVSGSDATDADESMRSRWADSDESPVGGSGVDGNGAAGQGRSGGDSAPGSVSNDGGLFGAVEVVMDLRDEPRPVRASAAAGAREVDRVSPPPWAAGVPVVTLRRTEARHLTAAVDFASNAWFRYPFADLVSESFPLERLDEALRAAAESRSLRIAIDPRAR